MKRKVIFLVMSILLLTGCGKEQEVLSKETEPETVEESPSTVVELDEEELKNTIMEHPVIIRGVFTEIEMESPEEYCDEYTLYMKDCRIDEIASDLVMAYGILSNDYFATQDEVMVQYNMRHSENDSRRITAVRPPEEILLMTPAEPFSIDMLYKNITEIWVFDSNGHTETDYSMDDSFVLELDSNGWSENNSVYNGYITVTDKDGKMYRTINPYEIAYAQKRYSDKDDPWEWLFYSEELAVNPIE